MADWTNFLNSDDFRAYRRKQAERVAEIIGHSVGQLVSGEPGGIDQLSGQLDVIHGLLRLPETLTDDENIKANLEVQLQEDIGNITTYLMREALREEEA